MGDGEREDTGRDGVPAPPGRGRAWGGGGGRGDPAPRRARAARDAVARRPPGLDQGGAVRPLPPELAAYAARLSRSEQSAVFLNEGWEFLMVDLRRGCSLQPAIQSEDAG